jgi:hypothetical protein
VIGETDRCWFPLAAGGDSDPCTLPGLRGKTICESCLSAAVILPLGCRLCTDGAYFIHVAEPDLQVLAVSEGVKAVEIALAKKAAEGIRHETTLSGRLALLEIISGSSLWDHTQPGYTRDKLKNGASIISFTNEGKGPKFNELQLPAEALYFFSALIEAGLSNVFRALIEKVRPKGKKRQDQDYAALLCDSVETRRSLGPLLFRLKKLRIKKKSHISGYFEEERLLTREERQMLQIYEEHALNRKDRFDALERIAGKINRMDHRDSFVSQLGNIKTKDGFLELFKHFCKAKKLVLTNNEVRILDSGRATELISLLYLLCNTEE